MSVQSVHYCALEDDRLLQLRGRDVPAFLQGQLSCDTRLLDAGHSVQGALCNLRGRVESDLRVLMWDAEHCALRVSSGLSAHVRAVLGKYAMFSRITIEEDSGDDADWQPLACWGADAAALVARLAGQSPAAVDDCVHAPGILACRADTAGSQFELYLDRQTPAGQALIAQLEAEAQATARCAWRALELRRGLFRLHAGEQDRHLPQALNYDTAGLISFTKGCYTGQEVVARLHYRGRAKRRLALFELEAGVAVPAPGTAVLEGSDGVGEVLRALSCEAQPTLVLALLDASAAADPAQLATTPPAVLRRVTLPYAEPPG